MSLESIELLNIIFRPARDPVMAILLFQLYLIEEGRFGIALLIPDISYVGVVTSCNILDVYAIAMDPSVYTH